MISTETMMLVRRANLPMLLLSITCLGCNSHSTTDSQSTTSVVRTAPALVIKSDSEQIIGTWEVVSVTFDGRERHYAESARLIFTDKTFRFATGKTGEPYRLDPTTDPKELDYDLTGLTWLAIYKLDGDSLDICFCSAWGGPRPKTFEGVGLNELLTCRRVQDP